MGEKKYVVGFVVAAAMAASGHVLAQQSLGMPAPVAVQPGMPAPVVAQPAMPASAQPPSGGLAIGAQAGVQPAAPVQQSDAGQALGQRNTLRMISEKKAELELLKAQAEIDKLKKPAEDASAKKDEAAGIAAALEQAKREQAMAQPAAAAASAAVADAPTVTLLATFAMPEVPNASYAELKVGDLLVDAKVGDRLPSGDYVKAIKFDSIEISKAKGAKKGQVVFISATDTASVYSSRGHSGSIEAAAPASAARATTTAPSGLPPMPGR